MEPAVVYLLEAYGVADRAGVVSVDSLRADIEGRAGLQVIGLVDVPADEAILCLLAADGPGSAAAIRELADRYGAGARLLEVSWAPG